MVSTSPFWKESAAIYASWGAVNCLPAATTAASMRSRRVAGIPFVSNTVIGTSQFYSTLNRINDTLTGTMNPRVPGRRDTLQIRLKNAVPEVAADSALRAQS